LKTAVTSISFAFILFCVGCGSGIVQISGAPNISQVLPQTIAAGTKSVTMKVVGTNFANNAVILWNGTALTTSLVDSNTLAGTIGSSSLAAPSTVQLQVQNAVTKESSQSVSVIIAAQGSQGSPSSLAISGTSLTQGSAGSPYSSKLTATGGTPTYTWSVTTGQLPAGLSLSPTTGVISGTPASAGNYSFGVTAIDSSSPVQVATATMALSVAAAATAPPDVAGALAINPFALPSGKTGSPYSSSLQANGGTAPYQWSISSGSLPSGLSLGASSGTISGAPVATGTANFTVMVTDSSSPAQSKSVKISLDVVSPLAITTSTLTSGVIGSTYTSSLQASGGIAPYQWSSTSALPAGLSLSAAGVLSGTPTASGNFSVNVSAKDSSSSAQTATASVKVNITAGTKPLAITSASMAQATQSQTYSAALSATGGTAPYQWSSTSALPAGLSLSAAGVLSGTPTVSGTFPVSVTVKDSSSSPQTVSESLKITVMAGVKLLAITSTALAQGTQGQTYSATLAATGGTAPYQWSSTSALPAGLSLSAGGVLSGTPTASGTFPVSVSVKDSGSSAQTASANLNVTVAAGVKRLAITSTALAQGTQSQTYSATLAATGGTAPYQWSSTSALPAGLSLSAGGVLSGTPTASGTFSVSVMVKDSEASAQSASANLNVTVAAASNPLTITSATLTKATQSQLYSATLSATGGTAPYSWSIGSGSNLPVGLSLIAGTGIISGTPTTVGSSSLVVTVTDSSSPALTKSANVSLAVAAAPLTVSSLTLAGGTVGTTYSSSIAVSGGTPAYMWTVSGGTLPAGLNLAGTTGVISGTPTATGTSKFTLSVSDNSTPAQTQAVSTSIVVAAATASAAAGNTWYVRPDGGTRFSSNVPTGQCDGTADVSYASTGGTGTNQHCAFNDVRYFWTDSSYTDGTSFPGWGWIGAGGDTYLIRGSLETGVSYRVGWDSATTYCSTTACWGITGNPGASGPPPPPSGTSTQHTRILGENYASCRSAAAKTQLHGGWGVGDVFNLTGSSYVDAACLDITDFSACGRSSQAVVCDSTQDFAQIGVIFSNTSTHDTLTDVHIHGLASSGITGPTGDGVVLSYVDMLGNASSGWNADTGDGTTGVGSLLVQNFNISWNGCAEEYPMVDPVPYGDCTDQSSGGYGDGFGTASTDSNAPGWQVHFDQGTVSYNTQDGLDALHISGPGSTMTDTRVLAFGNEGQQLKVGGATATIENSVIVGNCEAMTQGPIPGTPTGFGANLGAPCRAGDTAVLINVTPGDPATFQYNTIYEAGAIGLEVEYASGTPDPTDTLKYNNNIFVGFYNSSVGENATPIYSNTDLNMLTNPGASWTNNVTFSQRANWTCPNPGESKAICSDPGLVDETYHPYGYGNMAPSPSGSIVVGAGVAIPGITTDFPGNTRPNPPSIGAYEK
jgi:hypothetical protein